MQAVKNILRECYGNKDAVDDELVHLISRPGSEVSFNSDLGLKPKLCICLIFSDGYGAWGEKHEASCRPLPSHLNMLLANFESHDSHDYRYYQIYR